MIDADAQTRKRLFVRDVVHATIQRPSARDKQVLPGPSDLANPCDVCVARKIIESQGISEGEQPGNFSLKAWNGTAVHQKIERDLPGIYGHAEQEITVTIAHIEGLGTIKGHIDIYFPRMATITDVKTTDMKKLAVYRATRVPHSHEGQTMLYLYGLRKSGRKADTATLAYIPRDSNRLSDIWVASCAFREDIAVALLNRTRHLVEVVRSGDTSALASDPDCFVCHVQPKLMR